ncbi:hypothetical protein [Bacillus mycoides]|uniref:hypothetical protein n=1 Tax=Bacillus mycoides TaxID=1405 RepID=UPI0011A12B74|nr:hypothetical protein [Bacillus mycoides]
MASSSPKNESVKTENVTTEKAIISAVDAERTPENQSSFQDFNIPGTPVCDRQVELNTFC